MARPDSHAPIGVMDKHGHKAGEIILAYQFMVMGMQGLQSGTDTVETHVAQNPPNLNYQFTLFTPISEKIVIFIEKDLTLLFKYVKL